MRKFLFMMCLLFCLMPLIQAATTYEGNTSSGQMDPVGGVDASGISRQFRTNATGQLEAVIVPTQSFTPTPTWNATTTPTQPPTPTATATNTPQWFEGERVKVVVVATPGSSTFSFPITFSQFYSRISCACFSGSGVSILATATPSYQSSGPDGVIFGLGAFFKSSLVGRIGYVASIPSSARVWTFTVLNAKLDGISTSAPITAIVYGAR